MEFLVPGVVYFLRTQKKKINKRSFIRLRNLIVDLRNEYNFICKGIRFNK